jgi:hypothetical protein
LTANAQGWHPDEFTLELLAKFIGYIPDDKECEALEKNAKTGGTRMPAGTLKPLATALQNLRVKNKFKRLELRACNLGGNHDVMQLLGKVLGVRTIVAPRVHMFCLRLGAGVPDSQAAFNTWSQSHPRARLCRKPFNCYPSQWSACEPNSGLSHHRPECEVVLG